MQLHVSSTYAVNAINGIKADGTPIDLTNLALAIVTGDAASVVADETPSDNTANITTTDVVGATATLVGSADGADGSKFAVVPTEIELVAEDVPLGNFTLEFVELV